MGYNAAPLEKLIEEFSRFPGIGHKGATRMAYQVLSMSDEDAAALANAIQNAHKKLHRCRVCAELIPKPSCARCAPAQNGIASVICVVETPRDVQAFERTREYHGLYHVLHGLIEPHGRRGCRAALHQRAAGAAGHGRGQGGHHGDEPHCGGRSHSYVPCKADSNLWASAPPVWPMACRWERAWNIPTKRPCTGHCPAAGNCKRRKICIFFKIRPLQNRRTAIY